MSSETENIITMCQASWTTPSTTKKSPAHSSSIQQKTLNIHNDFINTFYNKAVYNVTQKGTNEHTEDGASLPTPYLPPPRRVKQTSGMSD